MADITFIMSVYNTREDWLRRSVDSVVKQTNPGWNLIIVDDGSKDETARSLDGFANADNRIKIHHQEKNKGLSSARNYGMDHAKTKWVTFLDADDWIEKAYVDEVLTVLSSHPELELLGIGHDDIWGDKTIDHLWGGEIFHRYTADEKKDIQMSLLQEPDGLSKQPVFFGAQWKFIYSLEFLDKYGIRNDPAVLKAQDSVFNLYVSEHMHAAGYYNHILYHYFHNSESVTGGGFNSNIVGKLTTLVEAYRKFLIDTGKFEDEAYRSAWVKVALLQFESMLSRYFMSKSGAFNRKTKKQQMKDLLTSQPYRDVICSECRELSGYRKILMRLMREGNYSGICALYRIKTALKKR